MSLADVAPPPTSSHWLPILIVAIVVVVVAVVAIIWAITRNRR